MNFEVVDFNYVLEFLFNETETVVTCAGGNLNQVFFAV